ncbi:hypothetical protein QJS10_CPB15g00490 [Acorus calamus]|uniref:Uncharacterized protein n=1 Tax=Acorus calamus TaxID=4465 RepID=A0AAV9DAP6_ACOCL|nr:hypothetical protein QJS10_CPB15g00490 [Acorus calamus]
METPSSMRRVTRSQTGTLASGKVKGEAEKSFPKSQLSKIDRAVLVDITNDSPIVGVAMAGNLKSPISDLMRSRSHQPKKTPGSGEALLRGQVKTLLQKVEEDAEFVKLTVDRSCPFGGIARSPMALLAPTPANTPYLGGGGLDGFSEIAKVVEEVEVIDEVKVQVTEHSEKEALDLSECMINRALLFDSPGKSDISDSLQWALL